MPTVAPPAPKAITRTGQHQPEAVELRGCRAVPEGSAGLVRQLCEADREVLPRWHQEDRGFRDRYRGHHELADPGAYARIRPWNGREHWLGFVVPAAYDLAYAQGRFGSRSPAAVAEGRDLPSVNRRTFMEWARLESLYVQDQRTGRRLIVRPSTIAGVMDASERTVQRCRQLARSLGLCVEVVQGRMLTAQECYAARERGSRQRGLSNESALTIPSPVDEALRGAGRGFPCGRSGRRSVDSVTPTSGSSGELENSPANCGTDRCAADSEAAPPPPRARRPRRKSPPAVRLAREVTSRVPWLAAERLSALIPTLHRFAVCDPAWTVQDLIDAIDGVNLRLGYSAVRAGQLRTRGAALLAWYLRDLDPQADHPRLIAFQTGTAVEQRPPWCGTCERRTRQILTTTANGDPAIARCPSCHPLTQW